MIKKTLKYLKKLLRHARPVLPQYHPKQLLELMNAGKINRVKAILMHLTRCIIDFELKTRNKSNYNLINFNIVSCLILILIYLFKIQ